MKTVRARITIADLDAFLDEIRAMSEETGATIQCFDARYVAGERHLRRAVSLAARAIERGTTIASDPAVEMLLYAAGRRQINQALEMGVSEGETDAVCVVTGGDEATAKDRLSAFFGERMLDGEKGFSGGGLGDRDTLCEFFEISEPELAVVDGDLEAIVLERVALLAVEK